MRPMPTRPALDRDPVASTVEDDAVAEETVRAVEILGMIFAEMALHRLSRLGLTDNPDTNLALRAMGTVSGRLAMTRLAYQTGTDEAGNPRRAKADTAEAEAVGARMRAVLDWLLVWDLTNPDAPPTLRPPSPPPPTVELALIELWDGLRYFDRRLMNGGVAGPGNRRYIATQTTRRAG